MISRSCASLVASRVLLFIWAVAVAFGPVFAIQATAQTVPPVQTCGNHNIRGGAVAGTFCGGTSLNAQCSSGAIYKCSNSNVANNCTLVQACASGCLVTDSPQGQLTSACYTGPKSLTVTPTAPLGGDQLSVTAQVASLSHPHGVILNLRVDRQDLVPGQACLPDIPANQTSETFGLSTAVVGAPTPVLIDADFDWVDPTGAGFELATPIELVTLGPGGHPPPPPAIASVVMNPTSTGPDGAGFMDVTLTGPAPVGGQLITVTSSDPTIAPVIAIAQPIVTGSCLTSVGNIITRTPKNVPKTETVTFTATDGAPGQAPLTTSLTVAGGCIPSGCSGGPTCGPQSDGCGGTIASCGCFNVPGQVCLADSTCGNDPNPPFQVTALTLNPSSITAGKTSIATVVANKPAPAGGGIVVLNSTNALATVPSTVTIPAGATTAAFNITTGTLLSGTQTATITADDLGFGSAVLTISPTVACTPQTCAQQGKTCGTTSDGCGGTLTCGACTGTTTCGGGGTPNVCGGTASTATLTVTATGGGGDITSVPSSAIKSSSGHPSSGVFNIGTSITLKTSDGHGAVWSGACSTNGAAAGSCTFTFTGAASVTANNK